MNRDKQIDTPAESQYIKHIEKRRVLAEIIYMSGCGLYRNDSLDIAEQILANGYRKASDVAEEIFAEIEKIIDIHYNRHIFGDEDLSDTEQEAVMNFSGDVTYDIAELKKKYAEDEG